MAGKKNITSIYEGYVLELIDKVTSEYGYPQKKHYNFEVAKLRTIRECQGSNKYTSEQVNPGVSRAIDKLSKGTYSPLIRYRSHYFLPNTSKYLFEKLSEEYLDFLNDKIKVESKDVCLISYNMCALFATPLTNMSVNDCIAECLAENAYAVLGEDDFFYVVVKCSNELGVVPDKDSKEFVVIRSFQEAIYRLYEKQHIQLTKKTKKQGT